MAAISGRSQGNWPTVFDAATCVRKGLCPVMAVRGQETGLTESHSLYFGQCDSRSSFKRNAFRHPLTFDFRAAWVWEQQGRPNHGPEL
jgi:hypothetical protein